MFNKCLKIFQETTSECGDMSKSFMRSVGHRLEDFVVSLNNHQIMLCYTHWLKVCEVDLAFIAPQ